MPKKKAEESAAQRFERALRKALSTPPASLRKKPQPKRKPSGAKRSQ